MRTAREPETSAGVDRLFVVTGTVQGVGFRPLVARLAADIGVRGWVRNDHRGVEIRLAGTGAQIEAFVLRLGSECRPPARLAVVASMAAADQPDIPGLPIDGFRILESHAPVAGRPAAVTPDLALCDDCRRELSTPGDRRHGYPFITCTRCGPRYSVLTALPYDRARTTMAEFMPCPSCEREYNDPADRRYHAETNACPVCGPAVTLQDATGRRLANGPSAIATTASALRAGRIVAVKGLGGFHLLVDAADQAAVLELRRRKHREEKPLAVMFPSIEDLRACTECTDEEQRLLTGAAAPVVLVRRRRAAPLADAIAPGNPWIGALLPYTPLHQLLLAALGRPVIATSGNISEEPLCTDDDDARARLGGIADLFLGHNRGIARPIDDSVLRPAPGGPIILRRARGFAPGPLALPAGLADIAAGAPLLCVGAHLKSCVAVAAGENLVVSPHIGDLENAATREAFRRAVDLLGDLHHTRFARVACDLHPDYASTHYADSLGLPVIRVQHHLAHILACLLEHDGGPDRVLGVAWDGTGYGSDGTIWGGEFIVVDRHARTAQRVAHLRPFRLPGSEAAGREPRRSALGIMHALPAGGASFPQIAAEFGFHLTAAAVLRRMLEQGVQAPPTTSAGRLFDAVAALLRVRTVCSFEGQAALELECLATAGEARCEPWPMPLSSPRPGNPLELDWGPMFEQVLAERDRRDHRELAARFHATLAAGIVSVARAIGLPAVVLTGGCFQNVRLLTRASEALRQDGFTVFRHHVLPPNDGAIAAGQALGALWGLASVDGGFSRRSDASSNPD